MGQTKRMMEDMIEKLCDCGAGCSLDPDEHERECKARNALKEIADGTFDPTHFLREG